MSVSTTSREAYKEHRDTGKLGMQAQRILTAMIDGQGYSRRELARAMGLELSSVCGRVNELLQAGLLVEGGEVDQHGLMRCPDIDLRRSVHLPPEEFEEAHIGHLDMRLHGRAASRCRSADCQLHEVYPNM